MYTWGSGRDGQLGHGEDVKFVTGPRLIEENDEFKDKIAFIEAKELFSAAITGEITQVFLMSCIDYIKILKLMWLAYIPNVFLLNYSFSLLKASFCVREHVNVSICPLVGYECDCLTLFM